MRALHKRNFLGVIALASISLPVNSFAGQVVVDKTFGHAGALNGPNFTISAGLGKQLGPDLFQSFSTFDLDKGDVATFTAPADVKNILARVTGGSASDIDGTIATRLDTNPSMPHPANLYFVNPAGVIFGPDAKLDVGGSFAVTTADYVRLSDGEQYNASSKVAPVLMASDVAAFGFLRSHPADVSITDSTLAVPTGKVASVVSGGIEIVGGTIQSSGGRVNLDSVATRGRVTLNAAAPDSVAGRLSSPEHGTVSLSDTLVTANGPAGGEVVVRGGALTTSNSAILAQSTGAGNSRGIDIRVHGDLMISGDGIDASTSAAGNAGDIRVNAQSLQVINDATISANSTGSGAAGDLRVSAKALQMMGGAQLDAFSTSTGNVGDVTASISGQAAISGYDAQGFDSGVFADSQYSGLGGKAGRIHFSAGELQLLNGGSITSGTSGLSNSGYVRVSVSGNATISGADPAGLGGGVFSSSNSTGQGGAAGPVRFSAASLDLLGGGEITSVTEGLGAAGDVTVKVSGDANFAGQILPDGRDSGIFANSRPRGPSGPAGSIKFSADALELSGGANISSSTFGSGPGGSVRVNVRDHVMMSGANAQGDNSGIFADSNASGVSGASGSIVVRARALEASGGAGISTRTSGSGSGGPIKVSIAGPTILESDGGVFASSITGGPAGNVRLNTRSLRISGGGVIASATGGSGAGGDVKVDVSGSAVISGQDSGGNSSLLTALSEGSGRAGDLQISAASLVISNGAQVSVTSGGSGAAGNTLISAGELTLSGGAAIQSSAMGSGNGGNITVNAGRQLRIINGAIGALSAEGNGGDIQISSGMSIVLDNGGIDTQAAMNGGNVHITAPADIQFRDSSGIITKAGTNGGNITIDPVELTLIGGSAIDANGGHDGGSIKISADKRSGLHTNGPLKDVTATGTTGVSGSIVAVPEQLDIVGSLLLLQTRLATPVTLEPQCGLQSDDNQSSFVISGRGGTPEEPGGWLPEMELELRPSNDQGANR